MKGPNIYWDWL